MISEGGKSIIEKFVRSSKALLTKSITEQLQHYYGIWTDGHAIPVESLPNQETDNVHTAKMLRERLQHLLAALPEDKEEKMVLAVEQLISEQAFTQLNRFCAIRMCEERELIFESISHGYDSAGFQSYDAIASQIAAPKYERYKLYLQSIFDELSQELPAVFDRFSPYGLVFPEESTLIKLLELINDRQLSEWYDEQNNTTVNFWTEDETLGWIFQNYNSDEERKKMRSESGKPRNSREMAVRNQFFTPEYIVRFLVDNSLGRIWYEMTCGESKIGEDQCLYMVRRPDEEIQQRTLKEPIEILSMDPTCGSMHFGIYLYEVYEYIYMDAWDHQPSLLNSFREIHTRESFQREVPRLILENNIYGCEIDPRALQLAALSMWLRAQKSYSKLDIPARERPMIRKSNLILAEAMPGNRRMLNGLMEELDAPMQKLIRKIWDKMKFVGEAGLLFKMEKEIADEIELLKKNWSKVNRFSSANVFSSDKEREKDQAEQLSLYKLSLKEGKEGFFSQVKEKLQDALKQLSAKLSEEEGYENALFTEDATRGFAFIELCQKRFDCIVMNPPFGEGSENTSNYLDNNYPAWCRNLVCAFFDRMQEMLNDGGRLGAIFDRTVMIKSSYEAFRKRNLCGFITNCADTGWGVLDANVETSTLVLNKNSSGIYGVFIDVLNEEASLKSKYLFEEISKYNKGLESSKLYIEPSNGFDKLPNSVIGYYFGNDILRLFQNPNLEERNIIARHGFTFVAPVQYRLFYEIINSPSYFYHLYPGGLYSLFYMVYRILLDWRLDGKIAKTYNGFRSCRMEWQFHKGIGYGERGDIVDTHVFKNNCFFNHEGMAFPCLTENQCWIGLSYTNSILSQYSVNLYTGQHKQAGNMNLIPMPDYDSRQTDIERIVKDIIEIKRKWFCLDETNLEFHGLIAQMNIDISISTAVDQMQLQLNNDYDRYSELVKENDDLWMDLAEINRDSAFRKTLNDYKQRRPYEELICIDGGCSQNVIDKRVIAKEIVQELVGIAIGRWDIAYATGEKDVPEFGDVFDALPFMPVVTLDSESLLDYPISIPMNGILDNDKDSNNNLARSVRSVIEIIWKDKAEDIEYELCQLIGCKSLQAYFENPNGFFDYHFKRYTKSRRKAPIYWPLSSSDGSITYWVYYPRLDQNTLHTLIMNLRHENERLQSLTASTSDRLLQTELRLRQQQAMGMIEEINAIISSGYQPNHDDGVPVTSCPLVNLISHNGWKKECAENLKLLKDGEYDWSHLAMSMFPSRVTQKAKKDWCLALTHGLEHICENKPKEKKPKKKVDAIDLKLDF